jgi:hypothetical protein
MVTGIGSGQRRAVRPRAKPHRGHGLRRHRAGRHPGRAQPQEDRPHAGHGARPASCPWCCSPKAAAAGRAMWTCPSSRACMCHTFASHAALSGQVPVVGIAAGRCFAGNAALLGCCDVIIATRASNIGMGGPAMIEGGGLGVFKPEQIGPAAVQHANGVIDVLVDDERPQPWLPPSSTWASSRAAPPTGQRPTRAPCATWCPRTACASTTRAPPWPAWWTPAACWNCAPASATASTRRWPASRAGRWA